MTTTEFETRRRAIVTRESFGLAAPRDMRGARLALPHRSDPHDDAARTRARRAFAGALAIAGLTLDDAKLVDVPDELTALRRGDVDAVFVHGSAELEAAVDVGAVVLVDLDSNDHERVGWIDGAPRRARAVRDPRCAPRSRSRRRDVPPPRAAHAARALVPPLVGHRRPRRVAHRLARASGCRPPRPRRILRRVHRVGRRAARDVDAARACERAERAKGAGWYRDGVRARTRALGRECVTRAGDEHPRVLAAAVDDAVL